MKGRRGCRHVNASGCSPGGRDPTKKAGAAARSVSVSAIHLEADTLEKRLDQLQHMLVHIVMCFQLETQEQRLENWTKTRNRKRDELIIILTHYALKLSVYLTLA